MNIIKQIYNGELFPGESNYPANPEYLRMRKELESKLETLNAMLDDSGRQIFEDVLSLRVNMDGMDSADIFETGFRAGAEVMIEVLRD